MNARVADRDSLGVRDLKGAVDFTLALAAVHEMPDARRLFQQAAETSMNRAGFLLAEPAGHVNAEDFEAELIPAARAGWQTAGHPTIRASNAALLRKT